jgi:uncharacterized phage protein (TIGR01671 family)
MNREIKFKIWDKEQGKFYEPVFEAYKGNLHELLITTSGELCERTLDPALRHESCFPDRYELMQFTGLTDKNGKEIYEGDIIEEGVVIWHDEYCGFFVKENNPSNLHTALYTIPLPFVVGNIYENQELLK